MTRMKAEAILLSGCDLCHSRWGPLRIRGVIDLSRTRNGEVPLLDGHSLENQRLGHVADAWIDRGAVKGVLVFDETRAGRRAFDAAGREETIGISCGVEFAGFSVEDRDGCEVEIDPEDIESAASDPDLFIVARHTQIVEVSMVPIPTDPGAHITRVFGGDLLDVQHRMLARHKRMLVDRDRREHQPPSVVGNDYDESPNRLRMPPKRLIQYTEPEPIL